MLDGSTINGTAVAGDLNGVVAGKASIASATTVDEPHRNAHGCSITASSLILLSDGVVFGSLHSDCAGALLLAGRVGDTGLNNVALDSFPGDAVAHLLVKVDLSR